MSKNRYSARTDNNEAEIVKALRKMGYSVQVGMDDILVGTKGLNFWLEIKDPKHVSAKTGLINESAKKTARSGSKRNGKVIIISFHH